MPIVAPFPSTPPPVVPKPSRWGHIQTTWAGWDGSTWDLLDWRSGVFLMDTGVDGLLMPPIDRYVSTSPAVAGSTWRGSRTDERPVLWPVYVYSATSDAEWQERDRAFWATMRPDQTGVWSVTGPDGSTRSLVLRFESMASGTVGKSPMRTGWMTYAINLVAEQPYWLGPLSYRHFEVGSGAPMFPADHDSPPDGAVIFISPSTTLGHAAIDNPGDLDAPLVYVLEGPWDAGASVGVGSAVTSFTSAIPDGQSVVVDMRPAFSGARSLATPSAPGGSPEWWRAVSSSPYSTDVYSQLGDVALNVRVEPGRSRELTVHATGQGRVHVALEPRFWRAW